MKSVEQADIMIVDDNPANLKLLEEMLRLKGHDVRCFPLGRLALAAAAKHQPELILLDINMPEMNGYDVCKRFKAIPDLSNIPIIFLSALTETSDKLEAFQTGGVDYISKPFQVEEVQARVQTHIALHRLERALTAQNEELEAVVALRTHQLAEANSRLTILDKSKTDFLSLISHELRTPLNGLLGITEIIFDQLPATPGSRQLREAYSTCRRRIIAILEDALLLSEIDVNSDRFHPALIRLHPTLTRAIQGASDFAAARSVSLPHATKLEPFLEDSVLGDEDLSGKAIQGLLETAIKFSDKGSSIQIVRDASPNCYRIAIEAHGREIPASALKKFFDVFAVSEAITPGGDLGLAPAIAQRILSLFHATVSVANLAQIPGIQLSVSLKTTAEAGAV